MYFESVENMWRSEFDGFADKLRMTFNVGDGEDDDGGDGHCR